MFYEVSQIPKTQRLLDALNKRYIGKIIRVGNFYTVEKVIVKRTVLRNLSFEDIVFQMKGSYTGTHVDYWFLDFQKEVKTYFNVDTDVSKWHIHNRRWRGNINVFI